VNGDYGGWTAEVDKAVGRYGRSDAERVGNWTRSVAKRIARLWGLPLPTQVKGTLRVHHIEVEDLTQQGWLGLLETQRTYDPGRGRVFYTYIIKSVMPKIWQLLRSSSVLPVPENYAKYREYQESGRFPRLVHLDENPNELSQDPDGEPGGSSFHEKVTDFDAEPPSARAEFLSDWDSLDYREREVVQLRVHLSVKEIAAKLNIDRTAVSRILSSAKKKLRA
jgi:RNA polymerase sigma factor (sigma-70 family)